MHQEKHSTWLCWLWSGRRRSMNKTLWSKRQGHRIFSRVFRKKDLFQHLYFGPVWYMSSFWYNLWNCKIINICWFKLLNWWGLVPAPGGTLKQGWWLSPPQWWHQRSSLSLPHTTTFFLLWPEIFCVMKLHLFQST